jgi:hypothetical protein
MTRLEYREALTRIFVDSRWGERDACQEFDNVCRMAGYEARRDQYERQQMIGMPLMGYRGI